MMMAYCISARTDVNMATVHFFLNDTMHKLIVNDSDF